MNIRVGSKNPVKVSAVDETIRGYEFLAEAAVEAADAASEVGEQPQSLEETIRGAMNRARNAYQNCDYSFGIEDGLMEAPHASGNFFNVCACVIHDGKDFHLGLSSAHPIPKEIMRLITERGYDMSQAFYETGLTQNQKLGSAEGAVAILTRGRLTRKDCVKQAVMMALIHLEQP
jgi:inosine/xanthosine triphosphatase